MREASVEQDRTLLESLASPEVESSFRKKKFDLLFVKSASFFVFLRRPLALDRMPAQMLHCVVGQLEFSSNDRESQKSFSLC